jgi:hypothetical protein
MSARERNINMTLAEALAQVDLEAGRTYDCVVNGKRITVQVFPGTGIRAAARFDESDIMLDPWCDLPPQGTRIEVDVVRGKLPISIPYIPQDGE